MGVFLAVLWQSNPQIDMICGLYNPFDDRKNKHDSFMLVYGRRNTKNFSFRPAPNSIYVPYTIRKDVKSYINKGLINIPNKSEEAFIFSFFNSFHIMQKMEKGYNVIHPKSPIIDMTYIDLVSTSALIAGKQLN